MKSRKIAGVGLALLAGMAVAFVVVNAVDYFRFHGVIRRLENLSDEQLRALGDAATRIPKPGRTDRPEGYADLQAIRANLWPGRADFVVYELKPTRRRFDDDAIRIQVRIDTSPHDQVISYSTNSGRKQVSKVLWHRNPEFAQQHAPGGRILTITQWPAVAGEMRSWIVLTDRILVVDESGRAGSEPMVAGRADLDAAGLARIKGAIAQLPEDVRGKHHRPKDVSPDPMELGIRFDPDGKSGPGDIAVSNTWVEELRPLLTAVSELAPRNRPIKFIEVMNRPEYQAAFPLATVQTLAERDNQEWPELNPPWWCVWRRWLD